MRRWTILLVSHDSSAPRSVSVSSRMLRFLGSAGVVVLLLAAIGVGSFIAQLGELRTTSTTQRAADSATAEIVALREQVGAINGVLDTIRQEDARLRAAAGAPRTDSATLVQRFLSRFPAFLRESGRRPQAVEANGRLAGDSSPVARAAHTATEVGDSLLNHAESLAEGYRSVGPRPASLDTLHGLALRGDSIGATMARATPGFTRVGQSVEWSLSHRAMVLAAFDAQVSELREAAAGTWEMVLRAPGGLSGHLRSAGEPIVHVGDRVARDEPLQIVPGTRDAPARVSWEVRRNGIPLDATHLRR